ncbi:MAG TPA: arsenosugar biosynthesis radical SAM (seleno)protein ArsS [Gammaproteobacteria bacterium]|nr:arsenosugar biosynthesis radical SAM (seleno)protein ArsS [Gammaproteobacteria bacterium]
MHNTLELLKPSTFPSISRRQMPDTLQINIGLKCNQQCVHCHVNASPKRKEAMSDETITAVIRFLETGKISTLDITGGAPELHAAFRYLVVEARKLGIHVIDRCNLTILFEPGQDDLADFLAEQGVEIIASLPCYQADNVDRQRGEGVFDKSIRALQLLNEKGYGREDSGLPLNLVYNPQGAVLPPAQEMLESEYKTRLRQNHAIEFNQLYTLCNMPIKRFGSTLVTKGQFHDYLALLKASHKNENLDGVMCKSLVSIDWQGFVYDCDFNQMLDLPLRCGGRQRLHIADLVDLDLTDNPIVTCEHCYGCTAGQGSSCGGALNQ